MAKLKIRRNPTRQYEAVYIIDSAIEDAAILEKLEKLQSLLNLATPAEIEHWGRRQLAYKIGRHDTGYYAIARFEITHTGAHTNHHARSLNAQARWKLGHRIAATAVLDIDVIDPNPHMLNQNLMGLGLWAVL